MVRRVTMSQLSSVFRQEQAKRKQAIAKYNREVRAHSQRVKANDQKVRSAVNQYNSKVRAHYSRVRANRNRLRQELDKLARAASKPSYRTIRTSVETVHRTYVRLESAAEAEHYGDKYNQVLDLSEREAANSVGAMNALLGNPHPSGSDEDIRLTTLDPILSLIGADLLDRWHGALFSLDPRNPDAARHFCTSAREILTRILDSCAPSSRVLAEMPDCERTREGIPTRRSKIRFLLSHCNLSEKPLEDFVEEDIKDVVQLFQEFNSGTHGSAGRFSLNQLSAIKTRVEHAVEFLWSIIPDDLRGVDGGAFSS